MAKYDAEREILPRRDSDRILVQKSCSCRCFSSQDLFSGGSKGAKREATARRSEGLASDSLVGTLNPPTYLTYLWEAATQARIRGAYSRAYPEDAKKYIILHNQKHKLLLKSAGRPIRRQRSSPRSVTSTNEATVALTRGKCFLVAMWRGHAAPKPEWLKSPWSSDYFIGVDSGLERNRCFRARLATCLLKRRQGGSWKVPTLH